MKPNWIGKAARKMDAKGTTGKFSAAADKMGMDTLDFANKELTSDKASPLMKQRANFAKNAIGARARKKFPF